MPHTIDPEAAAAVYPRDPRAYTFSDHLLRSVRNTFLITEKKLWFL